MAKVRWGIMSTARHGMGTVIPAIQESKSGEVVAIASRDAARARLQAKQLGIATSHGSYEALLADPNVDAIYIPLPNHLHKPWAIKAAQAGKHVLCEKPIALNAAEAKEIVAAFANTGLKLAEAFQWRHHPQALHARDLLQKGRIGTLRLIEAGFTFMLAPGHDVRWDPKMGGGALYDVGCYPISLARFMVGQEPVCVTAQARWSKSGVDEMVVTTMEFPGGVMATINCGFTQPLRRYYNLIGTEGVLSVHHAYNPKREFPGEVLRYGEDFTLAETIRLEVINSYTLMIEDFNHAVLDNQPTRYPPEDAIANMQVIDAIYQAARTGGTVKVAR